MNRQGGYCCESIAGELDVHTHAEQSDMGQEEDARVRSDMINKKKSSNKW